MRFADYYGAPFRERVIECAPKPNHLSERGEIALQPRAISRLNPAIREMSAQRQQLFATALFFTVLVDQVCYTYYRDRYERFRALTLYPKWKGDCPGGCYNHIHPRLVLELIGQQPGPRGERNNHREFGGVLTEALPVMRREVETFFGDHLSNVDGAEFWVRCRGEFPSSIP